MTDLKTYRCTRLNQVVIVVHVKYLVSPSTKRLMKIERNHAKMNVAVLERLIFNHIPKVDIFNHKICCRHVKICSEIYIFVNRKIPKMGPNKALSTLVWAFIGDACTNDTNRISRLSSLNLSSAVAECWELTLCLTLATWCTLSIIIIMAESSLALPDHWDHFRATLRHGSHLGPQVNEKQHGEPMLLPMQFRQSKD